MKEHGYVIIHPTEGMLGFTYNRTKGFCINRILKLYPKSSWKSLYNQVYRCIRVTLRADE